MDSGMVPLNLFIDNFLIFINKKKITLLLFK